MIARNWRFKNAWNCKRCPQSNGEDGCPCWWEYPNQNGEVVKGCYHTPEILMNFLMGAIAGAQCAAASADKATNAAAESTLAAQGAAKAATTAASLMLGTLMGEIQPVQSKHRIGGNDDGPKILSAPRPLD